MFLLLVGMSQFIETAGAICHFKYFFFAGINLYLVTAHEFGHSLGLLHSRNPASLMYPTYQKRRLQGSPLSFEDVHKIQTLYGMDIYITLHMSCIQIMLNCQYLLFLAFFINRKNKYSYYIQLLIIQYNNTI